MKRTIRLHESELHRIISESVRRILNEAVGSRKEFHETPHVSVKPGGKYTGRDPNGINYNVYVDGVRMFVASLCGSERDDWSGGRFQSKGSYSDLYINLKTYNRQDKNMEVFRQEAGYDGVNNLNCTQARENVLQIEKYINISFNDRFIIMNRLGFFTPENAPYIIQKCVEGLLTPVEKIRTKATDEVTFYDAYEGDEKTMTVEDAYKFAVSTYKDICRYGYGDDVRKPNEYSHIEVCLNQYADTLERIWKNEFIPDNEMERDWVLDHPY